MLETGWINAGKGMHAKMLRAAGFFALLFAGDAFAADPIAASMFAPPLAASLPLVLPQTPATEFRPRKRELLKGDFAASEMSVFDAPMLQDTSIARQMADSRSQDRVRLLTLWQSRASSLSLQAGRHGAPSLQWSTPWMHREATSHGLFDRLISVSPRTLLRPGAMAPAKAAEPASGGKPQ